MPSPVLQADLFGVSPLPIGLEYHAAFLTHDDEAALLDVIPELPFRDCTTRRALSHAALSSALPAKR